MSRITKEFRPPVAAKRAVLSPEEEVAQIVEEERQRPGSPWPATFLDVIGKADPSLSRPAQLPTQDLPDLST